MAVLVLAVVAGCSFSSIRTETHPEFAPVVRFGGRDYVATIPSGASIRESDLSPLGPAERIGETVHVIEPTVYALRGVDAARIMIMKAAPSGDGPYLMFIADGVLTGAGENELFTAVPELWPYYPGLGNSPSPEASS